MSNKSHPVDVHVGARIRQQRTLQGMSQTDLGAAVGITFQQVQKYENGSNRVSASRMWQFAQALGVPVASFFEGLQESGKAKKGDEPEVKRELLEFARRYGAIKKPAARKAVRDLVTSLAA